MIKFKVNQTFLLLFITSLLLFLITTIIIMIKVNVNLPLFLILQLNPRVTISHILALYFTISIMEYQLLQ
jgi:hypothetical protein